MMIDVNHPGVVALLERQRTDEAAIATELERLAAEQAMLRAAARSAEHMALDREAILATANRSDILTCRTGGFTQGNRL